ETGGGAGAFLGAQEFSPTAFLGVHGRFPVNAVAARKSANCVGVTLELICQVDALNIVARRLGLSRNDLEYSTASPADRLLHLLKTRGPQLAGEAGAILGTTGEAVRQQCVKL